MIETCSIEDLNGLVELAKNIYTGSSEQELYQEFLNNLNDSKNEVFLFKENNKLIGFAHFQIRVDYVEGVSSSPCGYLEGIFVLEGYRRKGIAKQLLKVGEKWSSKQDCKALGSDCHIDNDDSLKFHEKFGFIEVSRNIHFAKNINKKTT